MKVSMLEQARKRCLTGISIGLVALLALGGAAFASPPGGGGVIDGCYTRATGALRVIDPSTAQCRDGESALAWSQLPPQGRQGEAGPQGAKGDRGVDGPQGTKGERGPDGPAGPTGQRGPRGPARSPDPRLAWTDWLEVPAMGELVLSPTCPAGRRATGWGFYTDGADVVEAEPAAGFAGWDVTVTAGVAGGHASAVAVCVRDS